MNRILGIILARAGSIGLANKHLLPLLGRAVIEYTFDHARQSRRLTDILVTSDCARIRLLAQNCGLESISRPPELATDSAAVADVCLHALQVFEQSRRVRCAAAVVLYGNVPIRPAGLIDRAVDHLLQTGCDSVRSLSPVGKWHPAWMHRLDGDRMQPLNPASIHRRQDLEPIYLHDGAAIAVTRASLMRTSEHPGDPHAFFGIDRRGIISGKFGEAIEIDSQRDLHWAEAALLDRAPDEHGAARLRRAAS